MVITPAVALGIYQLAMLIKKDFIDRNQSAPVTDEEVIAGLQADVARVVNKIDDWNEAHPEKPIPPAL